MRHQAILNLYKNVVGINDTGALDAEGNIVAIDEQLVQTEIIRLEADYVAKKYQRDRAVRYPSITDYLDGVVKGDQAQIDKYIADCLAVKAMYQKPQE
jgi:hypothetical protein